MMKQDFHVFQGMRQDNHPIRQDSKYLWKAHNIRFNASEDNTLLSITNEKGNKNTGIELEGIYVGHCVVGEYLIIFTYGEDDDYIYRIKWEMKSYVELYHTDILYVGDLNFDIKHPLQTLGIYEGKYVQKVYWVDGKNQPRVINVVADKLKDLEDPIEAYVDGQFNFIQDLKLKETVIVSRNIGGGYFAPGTIQYAFTYYNKYGQESNIFYTTSLYNISFEDRGGSPEDKVSNTFSIDMDGVDTNFQYMRIYSIQRTSLNATPLVKIVTDIEISSSTIHYEDNGLVGTTEDPTRLLYIGGESIIAKTIAEKDNTLFLGNIEIERNQIPSEIKEDLKNLSTSISEKNYPIGINVSNNYLYNYTNQLGTSDISYFRKNNIYRLGLQFQYKTGKWSEPIWIGDYQVNSLKPEIKDKAIYLPRLQLALSSISDIDIKKLMNLGYKRVRPVIVLPTINDRMVITEGIINPTMFSVKDRLSNAPYAQSSWFFRPVPNYNFTKDNEDAVSSGAVVAWSHLQPLYKNTNRGAEIQNMEYHTFEDVTSSASKDSINTYFIDQTTLTLNSPDIEFDSDTRSELETGSYNFNIIGITCFTSNYGDISIETSTGVPSSKDNGFYHKSLVDSDRQGKILASGLFYKSHPIDDADSTNINPYEPKNSNLELNWLIYPWHRTGSLNNDIARTTGTRTSVLKRKVISNLRYSRDTIWFKNTSGNSLIWTPSNGITNISVFNSNEVSLNRLSIPTNSNLQGMNYYGNIDSLVTTSNEYDFIISPNKGVDLSSLGLTTVPTDSFTQVPLQKLSSMTFLGDFSSYLAKTKDPVRIKYKSTPHAVFSLNYPDGKYISLPCLQGTDSNITFNVNAYSNNELFWEGTSKRTVSQDMIKISNTITGPFLYIGEITRKKKPINIFGGDTEEALSNNSWIPAGTPIDLALNTSYYYIVFSEGDSYYQRYDCLKTYPFTTEDENSVVDIASFMCETYTNIDGRYDRNRGQLSNLNMSPTNFNLLNDVYTQKDNFFNYRILDDYYYKSTQYPSQIIWSLEKSNLESIDSWTNITLSNSLDLSGNYGSLTSIETFNDSIIALQEKAISNVLFNSRVQIPTSDNVPIEISNNYKVEGCRLISDSIGCKDAAAIAKSPLGLYFIDSNTDTLYLYNGQIKDIGTEGGEKSWLTEWHPTDTWSFNCNKAVKLVYDYTHKDLYLIPRKDPDSNTLCYSEQLGCFTSLMSYSQSVMFNYNNKFISLIDYDNHLTHVYENFAGDYNSFFGVYHYPDITYICNEDGAYTKIFDTIEYRADVYNDKGELLHNTSFGWIRAYNEYQNSKKQTLSQSRRVLNDVSLRKKFRVWRSQIPRNGRERMRNPWLAISLGFSDDIETNNFKFVLHDISTKYTI